MDQEKADRYVRISKEIQSQLSAGVCPILISATVEDSDLFFIRDNSIEIYYQARHGNKDFGVLLAYLIVDALYERYGEDDYGKGDIWKIISELAGRPLSTADDQREVRDITKNALSAHDLKILEEGKKNFMNTILLNSTSKYYAGGFFDLVYGLYRDLGNDLEYDYGPAIKKISDEYAVDKVKRSSLGSSFRDLVADYDLCKDLFEKVLRKIDANKNDDPGEDLGRWEVAFLDWFNDENTNVHRKSIKVRLLETNDDFRLKLDVPRYDVKSDLFSLKILVGNEIHVNDSIPVGTIRGKKYTSKRDYNLPRGDIGLADLFTGIVVQDSYDNELLKIPKCEALFFKMNGEYARNLSESEYKVLTASNDYDIPVLNELESVGNMRLIHTRLTYGSEYHIGNDRVIVNKRAMAKVEFNIPEIAGTDVKCDSEENICSRHPTINLIDNVSEFQIIIKDYANKVYFSNTFTAEQRFVDPNIIIDTIETGKYTMKVYVHGTSQFTKKYILIRGLEYSPDTLIGVRNFGSIQTNSEGEDCTLEYGPDDMFILDSRYVNGKEFILSVRTPNIFFNLQPANSDEWINASTEGLQASDFNNRFLISPGCIADGGDIVLRFRTDDMFVREYSGTVESGLCEFYISDFLEHVVANKCRLYLDLYYGEDKYEVIKTDSLGKYDIDSKNDILIITPYCMPPNCKTRYVYRSKCTKASGHFKLGVPAIFDMSGLVDLQIVEKNTATQEEFVIVNVSNYTRSSNGSEKQSENIERDPFKRAQRFETGDGCEQNVVEALKIYNKLADEGNLRALMQLSRMYIGGTVINVDYHKGAEYLQRFLDLTEEQAYDQKLS